MSRRFSKIIPKTDLELERFYIDVVEKLQGTTASLEEVDQRSTYPGASITAEIERAIRDIYRTVVAPMRSQISELERRINSIENSARF